MFNRKLHDKISALEYQLKELKRQTMGEEKKETPTMNYNPFWGTFGPTFSVFYSTASLKDELNDLDMRLDALLAYLKLDDKKTEKKTEEPKFVTFKKAKK